MSNPFSGILSQPLKELWANAIESLIAPNDEGGCAVECRLNYGGSRTENCPNCSADIIGQKSSNTYFHGGPTPFPFTSDCNMCNGTGQIYKEVTEDISLVVLWNPKDWMNIGVNVLTPEDFVQTVSLLTTLPKLKKAKDIVLDTEIEPYTQHLFTRHGEPTPCGLGSSRFIATMWKRI